MLNVRFLLFDETLKEGNEYGDDEMNGRVQIESVQNDVLCSSLLHDCNRTRGHKDCFLLSWNARSAPETSLLILFLTFPSLPNFFKEGLTPALPFLQQPVFF